MASLKNLLETTVCSADFLTEINSKANIGWQIPLGGNAYARNIVSADNVTMTIISIYIYSQIPGRVLAALRIKGKGKANISVVHNSLSLAQKREIMFDKAKFHLANCGYFDITMPGYTRFDIEGVKLDDNITDLVLLSDTLLSSSLKFVSRPKDFYYGRRGPSVHLKYSVPAKSDIEYFYNEVQVPKGQDVVGAYFCAIGFKGGYFGIQVNSEGDRRILFSIWSGFKTDDPSLVPNDYKIRLLSQGHGVYVNVFGNEGSGLQSRKRYMWEAGETYKFLVKVSPNDRGGTVYTAWFMDSSNVWVLIASFEQRTVARYIQAPYSFSENTNPSMGYVERHCLFSNQWTRDAQGNWQECLTAKFTANEMVRTDAAGGVGIDGDRTKFFLRNIGFLSDSVKQGSMFKRLSSGKSAPVNTTLLPVI